MRAAIEIYRGMQREKKKEVTRTIAAPFYAHTLAPLALQLRFNPSGGTVNALVEPLCSLGFRV